MSWMSRIGRISWASVVGAGLATGVGLILFASPLGDGFARLSYDLPFQFLSHEPETNLVLVYIDEVSHTNLNQRFNTPWPRELHTRLVDQLTEGGADMIFLDFVFSDALPADPDFARAMQRHGRVFIGATLDPVQGGDVVGEPTPILKEAAAGWGLLTHVREDFYGGIRRLDPGTRDHPSAPWVAAKYMGVPVPDREAADLWLNYYGPAGFLPSVSYYQVLSNSLPAGFFRGKAVFVGSRLTIGFIGALRDEFANPYSRFSPYTLSPGLEIQATTFLNLLHDDAWKRFPAVLELGLILLLGMVCGAGLPLLRPTLQVALVAVGAVAIFIAVIFLANSGLWWAWTICVGSQLPLALANAVVFNAVRAHTEKMLLVESLSKHFSPARVRQMLRKPELFRPGARETVVSILFSDIESFSKISEWMATGDLVQQLNAYYEQSIACVYETEGTVMDLVGDAIFAVWNAPDEQKNHEQLACLSALLLQERLNRFNEEESGLPMRTRVGLHSGTVFVGNIGSSMRFDYTAIGETVNLASRLEGLNKFLETQILATRDFHLKVEDQVTSRLLGYFKLKGLVRQVEVHEILGRAELREETRAWREKFALGLKRLQRQKLDEAEQLFLETMALRPGDGPSKYYLKMIPTLRKGTLDTDWWAPMDLEDK